MVNPHSSILSETISTKRQHKNMTNEVETSSLIQPWESHIEAAVRHLNAWDRDSARRVGDLQETMKQRCVVVFSNTSVEIQKLAKDRIHELWFGRSDNPEMTTAIVATFYSANWVHELFWSLGSESFLQKMTVFQGIQKLYQKDINVRSRIRQACLFAYPDFSTRKDVLENMINGNCLTPIYSYPDPNPESDWDSFERKKRLVAFYENLLFQEVKKYIFPHFWKT